MATQEGIFLCATIRRLPDNEAYDSSCIDLVEVTYREYVLEGASSIPVAVRFGDSPLKNGDTVAAPMVQRRVRLKPGCFTDFGYTRGCPGCDRLQIGGSVRRSHREACRARIEAEAATAEQGKPRRGRAKDRLDTNSLTREGC